MRFYSNVTDNTTCLSPLSGLSIQLTVNAPDLFKYPVRADGNVTSNIAITTYIIFITSNTAITTAIINTNININSINNNIISLER